MSYFIHGVVNVWCGACPITHMVWWMLPDHDDDDGDDYDVQKCRAVCKTAMKNSANQWRCYCRNISLWTLTMTQCQDEVRILSGRTQKLKVAKRCWKQLNEHNLMYIYHKQYENMQKNQWKSSDGQIQCFKQATSGALCWKPKKPGKLKQKITRELLKILI